MGGLPALAAFPKTRIPTHTTMNRSARCYVLPAMALAWIILGATARDKLDAQTARSGSRSRHDEAG